MQRQDTIYALPPHNIDAEKSVIGSILQDGNAVSYSIENLIADDFYMPENKAVFQAVTTLNSIGTPIDLMTVSNELQRIGKLDGIGGTAYLLSVIDYVPTTANIKSYVNIVVEKSTLRKLITACKNISNSCYTQEEPLSTILSSAEKQIYDIVMRRSGAETLKPISEVLKSTFDYIEKLSNLKGKLSGIPTGFHDLDRLLTGLHGGELVLVGARPGMGKTSVAIGIAQFASVIANKKAAIFSLEMPSEQIGMRLICNAASINMQRIRTGILSDEEWIRLGDSLNDLSNSGIYIDDTPGLTPSQLRSRCRRLKMEHGLDLIVLDYLQLMQSDKRTENRQTEVSDISRQLKGIAMELQIPVLACSQLSRRAANVSGAHRPVLSDLRESGAIEQDADVVIFIHRENYYKNQNDQDDGVPDNEGELIIAKQRNGPIGTVDVLWQPEFVRYSNKPGTKVVEFIKE